MKSAAKAITGTGKAQLMLFEAVAAAPAWTAFSYRPAVTMPTLLLLNELGSVIGPELVETMPDARVIDWAEGMGVLKVSVEMM